MRTLTKDNVIYHFGADNPFVYKIADGETFWVETDDCYNGIFKTETDLRTPDVDTSLFDAAVGPIEVENAFAGDTLCVEICGIDLADHGVMVTTKGLGLFGERITEPNTKIIPIKDGYARFTDNIRLPLTPMVGVLGVQPAEGQFRCTVPGCYGGNLDTKELKVGTKVFLPVFIDGAGLATSDIHACMGDGELSGTGLEIAGRICLKVTVMKDVPLARPVLETDEGIYMLATADTMEEAMKTACSDLVALLQSRLNLNFPDAYRLMSACCDIRISQVVNGVFTLKARAPKALFTKGF